MSAVLAVDSLRSLGHFECLLQAHMDTQSLTHRGLADLIGCSHTIISNALTARRRLPRKYLHDVANALRLEGPEYRDFLLAAHIDRADPAVREHINALRARLRDGGAA